MSPQNKKFQIILKNVQSNLNKNSIYLGLKKGISIPNLPNKINKFYSNIYIRILRVFGGICLLLVLTQQYSIFPKNLHKIIIIIGFIQSIQIILILIIKIIYGVYTLKYKSKDFEVRNSPLNRYATQFAKIIYCMKVGCAVTGGAAGIIGGGVAFDAVLVEANRKPFFVLMLGRAYIFVLGDVTSPGGVSEKVSPVISGVNAPKDEQFQKALAEFMLLSTSEQEKFLKTIKIEDVSDKKD